MSSISTKLKVVEKIIALKKKSWLTKAPPPPPHPLPPFRVLLPILLYWGTWKFPNLFLATWPPSSPTVKVKKLIEVPYIENLSHIPFDFLRVHEGQNWSPQNFSTNTDLYKFRRGGVIQSFSTVSDKSPKVWTVHYYFFQTRIHIVVIKTNWRGCLDLVRCFWGDTPPI